MRVDWTVVFVEQPHQKCIPLSHIHFDKLDLTSLTCILLRKIEIEEVFPPAFSINPALLLENLGILAPTFQFITFPLYILGM